MRIEIVFPNDALALAAARAAAAVQMPLEQWLLHAAAHAAHFQIPLRKFVVLARGDTSDDHLHPNTMFRISPPLPPGRRMTLRSKAEPTEGTL